MNSKNEIKQLLNLLNNGIKDLDNSVNFADVNFNKLFEMIDKHAVNMLCLDGAKSVKSQIPDDVYFDWLYFASRKMTKNEDVLKTQQKLTHILENNDVKYFVFKGLCSASYYKKSELRELGDIDFYIDFSDFKYVNKLLLDEGFELISTHDNKHWNYSFNGVEVEMHHKICDLPDNVCGNFLNQHFTSCISNRKKYTIDDYSFYGPDDVTHGIILILHIVSHLQQGGIGLRHLCDYAVFMNSDSFKKCYETLVETFRKGGILKTACVISKICSDIFGFQLPDFAKDVNDEIAIQLQNDILLSGNFGNYSKESYYGSSLFTSKKSENASFFKSLFSFCQMAWKPCKNHKILLPIAPFFIGIRYLFRAILGKRPKINPMQFTKTGVKRASLYKELNFFKEN